MQLSLHTNRGGRGGAGKRRGGGLDLDLDTLAMREGGRCQLGLRRERTGGMDGDADVVVTGPSAGLEWNEEGS